MRKLSVAGIALLLFVLAACVPTTPAPTTSVPTSTTAPSVTTGATTAPANGSLPSWLTIYFTKPSVTDENDQNMDHYVAGHVLSVVNAAQKTLDVTSFDLNLPAFVDALVNAQKRGVKVRVVIDGKNGSQDMRADAADPGKSVDAVQVLQKGGITVVDDGRSNGLMHDKLIIVDGKTLFMGSWNMSYNDTLRNNNNLLMITNPTLIANYQAKFNELFVNKTFGTKAQVKALTPSLTIEGMQIENYFSPPDHVMDKLIAYVQAAKKSVRFMAFTYTDKDLANAMIARAQKGVTVEGVIENRGASQGAFPLFTCANLPVKTDGNKYTMHHKVIIIDDQTVITGSFNFTNSADEANDDNVLILHSPAVAQLYDKEFASVYALGKVADPAKASCN